MLVTSEPLNGVDMHMTQLLARPELRADVEHC
jgi:hypothetical protein